jgi:hypothetical protein
MAPLCPSVDMYVAPNNIWAYWQIFMKLDVNIISYETTPPWVLSFCAISNTNMVAMRS